MSPLPRLSIVTLSYNQARHLPECLYSVASQKAPGIDFIVVDPGSQDGSRRILADWGHAIDRQILEPDQGPADGLNKGFAAAGGEVFGYINADDRLAPGALDFVRRHFAAHPETDVLCGAIRILSREGRASLRARVPDPFDPVRYAAGLCVICQQGTFFRRSAFERAGGFNADNRVAWDGELLADMALQGARFARVRRVLGEFRVYGGTISNNGAYREKLAGYYRGLDHKLLQRGMVPYSPLQRRLGRLLYRANPLRHVDYLLARWS